VAWGQHLPRRLYCLHRRQCYRYNTYICTYMHAYMYVCACVCVCVYVCISSVQSVQYCMLYLASEMLYLLHIRHPVRAMAEREQLLHELLGKRSFRPYNQTGKLLCTPSLSFRALHCLFETVAYECCAPLPLCECRIEPRSIRT
jgi:hypothetical protein